MSNVRVDPDQRSMRNSEPNLVVVLDLLRIGILDFKSQFDIVDCSLRIVPPKFFLPWNELFINFPKSSYLYVMNVYLQIAMHVICDECLT